MRYVPRRLVPILLYHHFGSVGRPSRSYISPALFHDQLRCLRDRGYRVVGLGELIEALREGERVPPKTVALTIDDGWLDNYEAALPIIRRFGFPVTIFLVSGRIGRKGYLGWQEIREMRKAGVRFGAHSVSHPRLTEVPPEEAWREIAECKKRLEDGLEEEVTVGRSRW